MDLELQTIRDTRQRVYWPNGSIGLLLIASLVGGAMYQPVGMAFGVLCMLVLLKRIKRVARLPCPHCGKPFGTSAALPLGVGGPVCENCGLHLHQPDPKK